MKFIRVLILALALPMLSHAHIGSPGVTFEGKAGDYPVMVLVNPPDVIPGTASIDIFTDTKGITAIWAKPVFWFAGAKGTPEADKMLPVAGEPGHFRGKIWLMDNGALSIQLDVNGGAGAGTILVPVMAVSTVQRVMDPSLGWMLAALALLLVVLMITIISACVSDSLVKPGHDTANLQRKKWTGIAVSTGLLLLMLYGGKSWWNGWAQDYQRFMYHSFKATTTISENGKGRELTFSIDTTAKLQNLTFSRKISYIIPDHGKLMHLFIVRAGTMDAFAHLHPKRKDSVTFVTPLPPLPEGTYLAFADVTRLSAFSETIPDTFEIKAPTVMAMVSSDSLQIDPDDTYFFTNPVARVSNTLIPGNKVLICGKPGIRLPLADGSTITWEHDVNTDLTSNTLYSLKFNLQDEAGKPALLEPYLGMAGHAVIMKDDGSVYIHLHPVGSYSMASQQTMVDRFKGEAGPIKVDKVTRSTAFMDSIDHVVSKLDAMPYRERDSLLMGGMNHRQYDPNHAEHSVVSFPYSFPSAGHYRIWIQMKRNGRILNSAFDADVK
ncbi:MAG: hypothetical protein ABJA70_07765 [Chryseolinea sp.]